MRVSRHYAVLLLGTLLLASLACGLSLGNSAEVVGSAVEQAQTAAAQAADLVGTAEAAATQGADAVATLIAAATPHVDLLKEKLAGIEPDDAGNYRVSLTEAEVNTVLRLRQLLTGDVVGAGIQSQEVSFSDGRITLSGSVLEPLTGQLLVSMRPLVEGGDLQLEIIDASVSGGEAPQEALEAAERAISDTVGAALAHLPAGVVLEEIVVANSELTIIGRRSTGE